MLRIKVKRAYEDPGENDGFRILVDRVWPRGRSKSDLRLDAWIKEIAPSSTLRQWFGHDLGKWDEFKRRYFIELEGQQLPVDELLNKAKKDLLTLVYGARDEQHNNAVALKEYLAAQSKL